MDNYFLALNPGSVPHGAHDSAAVLFKNGIVEIGVEEERVTRQKHAPNSFPGRAIRTCLAHCDIELRDLEKILIPWHLPQRAQLSAEFNNAVNASSIYVRERQLHNSREKFLLGTEPIRRALTEFGEPIPPIVTENHHRCHAASAIEPAPFSDGLVVTADGRGEFDSTVVWAAEDGELARLRTYEFPNSLGLFYGTITELLGYRADNGEGKVMGLAPYGERNDEIESRLRDHLTFGTEYDVSPVTTGWDYTDRVSKLERILNWSTERPETDEFTQKQKDLAAVCQHLLEETVCAIVREYIQSQDTTNLALAGGVALNCKLNQRLAESQYVDQIFVQPVANDAGTALGVGYLHDGTTDGQQDIYLGNEYSAKEIERAVRSAKLEWEKPDDLLEATAEKLADGKLIGWFQGPMEIGPRALGNRSILADPRSEASRNRVNDHVKHREGWRPFAPSILADHASEYLENVREAPYMIQTFDMKAEKVDTVPAVVHPEDQTTRPQIVSEACNPRYYTLIELFWAVTGVPMLLNTSFNDHGEPIVRTPTEAIKTFSGIGLDALVLGDVLLTK